ncbi:hypothetical protein M0R45_020063 [Rubus argutus]|uniref:Uncharacterized protein n=1 Tax=Rubus argutus TaxID=59490 RepID=A0AAW1X9A9_RUBAR
MASESIKLWSESSPDLGTPELVVMMKIHGVVAVSCSAAGVTVVAVREARGRGLSGSSDVAGDLEERKRRRRLVGEQSAAGAARW